MKISVKHLFTLVLRAETEKPAERGQGSIMPSNKFICWEVVKRGRAGGGHGCWGRGERLPCGVG